MSAVDVEETAGQLADFYRHLAVAEFAGYCEPYAGIARAIAEDHDLLVRIAGLAPKGKVLPILVFAAMHDLVLAGPTARDVAPLATAYADDSLDPWPPFRALLVSRFDAVAATVRERTVQTNEVGRSAAVLVTLTALHRRVDRPLALIEIGASAGLNLQLDRFGYHFADGRRVGDPTSPVQLTCEPVGPLVPPVGAPPLHSRLGIDLSPVDVTDENDRRWLEACLWPGQHDRLVRLRGAMDLARRDPVALLRGPAADLVADAVRAVPDDVVPVVTSTWVLAYFVRDGRAAFGDLLDGLGAERDLAFVSMEYPGVAPFVAAPAAPATATDGKAASVIGLSSWHDGRRTSASVAWVHAHGRWLEWVDEATADPSGRADDGPLGRGATPVPARRRPS